MKASAVLTLLCLLAIPAAQAAPADSSLSVGGGSITIRYSNEVSPAFRKLVETWTHDAAEAVLTVYGHYPVKQVTIQLQVTGGSRVGGGRTFDGRLIKIRVGSDVTAQVLRSDWIMTHEMFHLGFPDIVGGVDWMGEGLSTYLEPLARARAGNLTDEEVWASMVDGLPKGLPQGGDRGLDRTPTWGRTYWGGTLFWLLADLEIRKASNNHKSLDDALRAILAEGGDGSSTWPEEKVFRRGDAALGMQVLETLHERLGVTAETTDLSALWRDLGVVPHGRTVTFDDKAPHAAVRRALTRGDHARGSPPSS
jgi:hypothetical protein